MNTEFSRKNSKLFIAKVIIYVVEVVISLILTILTALWDEVTLSKGIAMLSGNIASYFLIYQLMEVLTSKEESTKQEEQFNLLKMILDDIKIEEIYKKVYSVEDISQKERYLKSLKRAVNDVSMYINQGRSGQLTKSEYYDALFEAGKKIEEDKKNFKGKNYPGEIWAMTFWQDEELNRTNKIEESWLSQMKLLDDMGIPTRRLSVMTNKRSILKRNELEPEDENFLQRIQYYASINPECKNTTVYAIDDLSNQTVEFKTAVTKGFFAIKLSNGSLELIRAVSLDAINEDSLCGEIVYDKESIQKIYNVYNKIISHSAQSLKDYLNANSSPTVKGKMKELGFDI